MNVLLVVQFKGLDNFTTNASSVNISTTPSTIDYTDIWKPRMREVSIFQVWSMFRVRSLSFSRVTTRCRYMGSGIKGLYRGGIRDLVLQPVGSGSAVFIGDRRSKFPSLLGHGSKFWVNIWDRSVMKNYTF